MRPLYKTTIVIWSEVEDNPHKKELEVLARDAVQGNSYCSRMRAKIIDEPESDPDWDNTEFFDEPYETGGPYKDDE